MLSILSSRVVYRRGLPRGIAAAVGIFLGAAAIYLASVMIENQIRFGHPVPLAGEVGMMNYQIFYILATACLYYLPSLVLGFGVAFWLRHRARRGRSLQSGAPSEAGPGA